MPVQILTIARNTFVESIRQPIFFVLVMLTGLAQLMLTWSTGFNMGYSDSAEVSGDNKSLLEYGLATVLVAGTLLAAFIATAVVSREIENKTILTVVSKPVSRPAVIVGKYLGVAGAILLAVIIMTISLLMGIRHGVMTTAGDSVDGPVLLFSFAAVAISIGIAVWGNYFYGWYFSQTAMLLLLPASVVAYVLVLLVSKKWGIQPIWADFKPQVSIACLNVAMALMVLTAVATAVSTRLGQVMTIVVCAGVFMLGLLSNYLFGRHAFVNVPIVAVSQAAPADETEPGFSHRGATFTLTLGGAPKVTLTPGASIYYGPSPNGYPMAVPRFAPFQGDPSRAEDLFRSPEGAVIVAAVAGDRVTIRNVGDRPVPVDRPPEPGDYLFLEPTRVRPVAMAVWAATPNFQDFWLVDAVSQNRLIPARHVALAALYTVAEIGAFLALAVVLFQKRDVG